MGERENWKICHRGLTVLRALSFVESRQNSSPEETYAPIVHECIMQEALSCILLIVHNIVYMYIIGISFTNDTMLTLTPKFLYDADKLVYITSNWSDMTHLTCSTRKVFYTRFMTLNIVSNVRKAIRTSINNISWVLSPSFQCIAYGESQRSY